jgi:tricorn protease
MMTHIFRLIASQNARRSRPWQTQIVLASAICVLLSALTPASGEPFGPQSAPLWMRYPAISPDAKTIAFIYHGHLFTVASGGGQATALTAGTSHETAPVWSRDGRLLAFASDRYGHYDVYVIGAEGGAARRLTSYSVDQIPTSFTPDNQSVLFSAHRMDLSRSSKYPTRILPELYSVAISQGQAPTLILSTSALGAHYDIEGRRILYEDLKGYEDPWRKHETYANAHQIFIYDSDNGRFKRMTAYVGENRNPQWAPDEQSIYYLSEQSGSFNVWQLPLESDVVGIPHQLTRFDKNPVRFLTVAQNGVLCFGFGGEIYVLAPDSAQPRKIQVRIALEETKPNIEVAHLKNGATEMDLSPNGKEIAFVVRGDIYVSSVETGDTRRITNTPGQERNVSFSPDGRHLVFSAEYNRPWALYEASIVQSKDNEPYFFCATGIEIHSLLDNDRENTQPKYAPDGKEVAYFENRTTLKVLHLSNRQSRTILAGEFNFSAEDGDQWYAWSPDGKWFLVTFLDRNRWSKEAGLVDAGGRQQLANLTKSGYEDTHPQWAMNGKSMTWISDKYGLHGSGYDSDFDGDVLETFFSQAAAERFHFSRSEYSVAEEQDRIRRGEKQGASAKNERARAADSPAPPDLRNLPGREVRLTLGSSNVVDSHLSNDGESLLYLTKGETSDDLWLLNIRSKQLKRVTSIEVPEKDAVPRLSVNDSGTAAYILAAGKITKIDVDSGSAATVQFDAEKEIDGAAERAYLFDHIWRLEKERFFDPVMNGVDWNYYKEIYARFLPYIDNDEDFAEMCSEMVGELNSSHMGCRFRRAAIDDTAALGAFYDPGYRGPGLRIQEIIENGPLDGATTPVSAGMVIEAVDQSPIAPGMDPSPLLNHRANRRVGLRVLDPASNTRFVTVVKPIELAQQEELLYKRWVKQRREEVERISGGQIGYVHIKEMNQRGYREMFTELFGRDSAKKAVIIDSRANHGGHLRDDLVTLLSGKQYLRYVPRGQMLGWDPVAPVGKWAGRSALLINEDNYSDGHLFPWVYQHLGLGTVIGMPIPGTGTSASWEQQQDPQLIVGVPYGTIEDAQGNAMEKVQVEPDIEVMNDAASIAQGKDLQLDRAIKVLTGIP